jgi:hypothetical protein
MIRALLVLLATLLPASAETARVLSGEHGDFTRLVIELPTADSWTLGRTEDGYAFAANGKAQPDYDLDRIWQRIDRNRLTSLARDSGTGALVLALGCDCHVFPFEYQPGIVVLDIKPGPAPAASAFEAAFSMPGAAAPSDKETQPERTYDWRNAAGNGVPRPVTTLPLPLETGSVSLKPLRDELLEQIAQGAANGIVDMQLPGKPQEVASSELSTPWLNIHIGESPGIIVTEPNALVPGEKANAVCAPTEVLNLGDWADGRLPHDLLVEARNGLFGEFDAPNEPAVLHSVQLLLYLGFGAEAGQTADLLGSDAANDRLPLYRSMARLVDGDSDPQTPFAAMLECDGPAALWAALAHDRLPVGPEVNGDAIVQAFQALPSHLRRHLGPALAEKFLERNDSEAARIIRDAIERSPDADPAAVALLEAKADLHNGDTEAAIEHAEAAVALDGDQADNLIALVETHFRKMKPLDPGVAEALMAVQGENEGTERGPAIHRAIVLALALSDQTEAAFMQGGLSGGVEADLWRVVHDRAADDDFLRHAVLAPDAQPPGVDSDVKLATARRLLALGFSDAALTWLGPVALTDAPELRLLAAQAETASGNATTASELLTGLQGPEAETLRAKALEQLGDLTAASAALVSAGETEAAARLDLWRGDWDALKSVAPDAWLTAAEYAKPAPVDVASGLLGRGNKTIDASLASRSAIEALLATVPSPAAN